MACCHLNSEFWSSEWNTIGSSNGGSRLQPASLQVTRRHLQSPLPWFLAPNLGHHFCYPYCGLQCSEGAQFWPLCSSWILPALSKGWILPWVFLISTMPQAVIPVQITIWARLLTYLKPGLYLLRLHCPSRERALLPLDVHCWCLCFPLAQSFGLV